MFDRIFADYLLKSGKLSQEQLDLVFETQEKKRARLGVIAISEQLMTVEQAEEVNQLQAVCDKRFGDIAVEKGYLTDEQVSRLLSLQGNLYLSFVQSIVDNELLSMQEINEAQEQYQRENSFTLMDMENLKSCDIDRTTPIFLHGQPELLTALCGVMARTTVRLVDYHAYMKKPYIAKEVPIQYFSMQELFGDHNIITAITGPADAMKQAAIGFAGEQYISDEEDALDAICELINCVNGLFATDMSLRNIEVDMKAPYYQAKEGILTADSLLCLPIIVSGKEITLITAIDTEYSIK